LIGTTIARSAAKGAKSARQAVLLYVQVTVSPPTSFVMSTEAKSGLIVHWLPPADEHVVEVRLKFGAGSSAKLHGASGGATSPR
jgi:hypothetical protein